MDQAHRTMTESSMNFGYILKPFSMFIVPRKFFMEVKKNTPAVGGSTQETG